MIPLIAAAVVGEHLLLLLPTKSVLGRHRHSEVLCRCRRLRLLQELVHALVALWRLRRNPLHLRSAFGALQRAHPTYLDMHTVVFFSLAAHTAALLKCLLQ